MNLGELLELAKLLAGVVGAGGLSAVMVACIQRPLTLAHVGQAIAQTDVLQANFAEALLKQVAALDAQVVALRAECDSLRVRLDACEQYRREAMAGRP